MKNFKWVKKNNMDECYKLMKVYDHHECVVGYIAKAGNEWMYNLDGDTDYLDANNLEDAKVEFISILKEGYLYELERHKIAVCQLEENIALLSH